jgi:hypothetical protein
MRPLFLHRFRHLSGEANEWISMNVFAHDHWQHRFDEAFRPPRSAFFGVQKSQKPLDLSHEYFFVLGEWLSAVEYNI